jgi:hypothetical protein
VKRLAFALVLFGSVGLARADIPGPEPDFGERPVMKFESPQRFSVEIKFTPYTPHIDHSKGLNGATPFADLFNSRKYNAAGAVTNQGEQPPYRLLSSVEFDYQILHRRWGTLGAGLTTGFYRRTTHSYIYDMNASGQLVACQLATCQRSGDTTGLNIMPLSALVEYRYDYAANHYRVPLVPYVRGGLAYYIWWINDGSGILSGAQFPRPTATMPHPSGQSTGYGGSFGIVLNPGIALQLDWLDRTAAITMDHELGINHIYIFAELSYAWVNGFNASNKLDLSDTMVNSGIGFEF